MIQNTILFTTPNRKTIMNSSDEMPMTIAIYELFVFILITKKRWSEIEI